MNYPVPRAKAIPIPMTKLRTTFLDSPTLSIIVFLFNYCLSIFILSQTSRTESFFNLQIVQAYSHLQGPISSLTQCFFLSFFLYLFICFHFFWMMRKQRKRGGTYRFFLFYSIWISPLIPTVIVKLQINFYNDLMLVK